MYRNNIDYTGKTSKNTLNIASFNSLNRFKNEKAFL